jgi:uncharacterized sulfatase
MWTAYYGAISYVDHLLGILLEALIDTDQWDNTLLIYTSDHGEMLGSHGLLRKGACFYEELMNVPLLVRPPRGHRAPHVSRRLISHVDVASTILQYCAADVPGDVHGVDLRPLIVGGDVPIHDGVAFEYHSATWGDPVVPLRGWRTEDWKLVEGPTGPEELYDLRNDPLERQNLVSETAATRTREALHVALFAWLARTADPWPQVPYPPGAAA